MPLSPAQTRDIRARVANGLDDLPIYVFDPKTLDDRVSAFQNGFPGALTFAVKANPAPDVIKQLFARGVRGFDVASPQEIALVQTHAPGAALHYHNPVRSLREIHAGISANVESWSVDDMGELEKLHRVGVRKNAEIAVRFKLPVSGAHYDFGSKFGANPDDCVQLLKRAVAFGYRPSLTFHVGTQCGDPKAFKTYIEMAASIAESASVKLHRLNVGGGFPAQRTVDVPGLKVFFAEIASAASKLPGRPELVCEPGRALVADAFAYAVPVKSRRDNRLYLADGIYGGLSEFASMSLPEFSVFRSPHIETVNYEMFTVFGPTCDSLDQLPDPLLLPASIAEGDWIVFSSMGAYLHGVTTQFNGYGEYLNLTSDASNVA